MRSVVVVLPASMCAAMPMLRVRSSGYSRVGEFADLVATAAAVINLCLCDKQKRPEHHQLPGRVKFSILPTEVRESLVCLRHLVNFIPLPDRVPLALICLLYTSDAADERSSVDL